MKEIKTLICGGDARMLTCGELFSEVGQCLLWNAAEGEAKGPVRTDTIKDITNDYFVILPIPSFDKNGILNNTRNISAEALFSSLPHGSRIFGGKFTSFIKKLSAEYGHKLYDYTEREDFNLFNAVPTAEAAMLLAMESSAKTIYGGEFTIAGYGRIGKALAGRLLKLGGRVWVSARREESLASAECDGCKTISLSELHKTPFGCDCFFNTIPCTIFDVADAEKWSSPLFIELASLPGGFTEPAIKFLKGRYISALSLPGKYFPVSAGEIIYKTVSTQIRCLGGNLM